MGSRSQLVRSTACVASGMNRLRCEQGEGGPRAGYGVVGMRTNVGRDLEAREETRPETAIGAVAEIGGSDAHALVGIGHCAPPQQLASQTRPLEHIERAEQPCIVA